MAREIFIRKRNRNFPKTRICFCCELLCFQIILGWYNGSILSAKHEDDPHSLVHGKYAIALVNSESDAVGHIPKFMSKLAQFFVKHVRKIRC